MEKNSKHSAIFNEHFEIRERCKGVHCVDLGESFQKHVYLENLASIQPRTSPVKFAGGGGQIGEGYGFRSVSGRLAPRHQAQPRLPAVEADEREVPSASR